MQHPASRFQSLPPDVAINAAVESLRDLWREGLTTSQLAIAKARRNINALIALAPSEEAVAKIRAISAGLDDYRQRDEDGRAEALKSLAAQINTLRPILAIPAPAHIGKLNSAIAPGRDSLRPARRPMNRADIPPLRPEDPVVGLPGVGPALAKKLAAHKRRVETVGDILALPPIRHIDFSRTIPIHDALTSMFREFGDVRPLEVTLRGQIADKREVHGAGTPRIEAKLSDGTGTVKVTWFGQFAAKGLVPGDEIVAHGELTSGQWGVGLTGPEWRYADGRGSNCDPLVPVYPLTKGLFQGTVRSLTRAALDATRTTISDPLLERTRREYALPDLWQAFSGLHYPTDWESYREAGRRLAFDDLFFLQLGYLIRRRQRSDAGGIALVPADGLIEQFVATLPFRLTGDQEQVLADIVNDLGDSSPMTRLLQGDVGSGKTVVAAAAALVATSCGYQAAVMAPTEILAEQHYHNLRGLYSQLPVESQPELALLTGSTKARERKHLLESVRSGFVNVLVGTHALIQSTVSFDRLALTVVDEQHRFGVKQRGELSNKGQSAPPHVLAMTATPIPRTLNLVLHGDLDVSVIAERPPGRIPIQTRRYGQAERELAYELVRQEVEAERQVFVICPLVEESEQIEARAATEEAERLQRDVFPDLRVALLHGRMSGRQKDQVMTAFRDREADILVSTSVIEVGIDIPNATIMMIEGAERFGLSQLHQFRGRVGRGAHQSYCLLLSDAGNGDGDERMQSMVESDDGFVLAQKDLELRGPGDFLGTRQSGLPEFSWLVNGFDTRVLDQARQAAEAILVDDPDLTAPEHQHLRSELDHFWEKAGAGIAP